MRRTVVGFSTAFLLFAPLGHHLLVAPDELRVGVETLRQRTTHQFAMMLANVVAHIFRRHAHGEATRLEPDESERFKPSVVFRGWQLGTDELQTSLPLGGSSVIH